MKLHGIAVGVCLLAFGDVSFAADLNAPVSTTPTLGSEIHRGGAAAADCAFNVNFEINALKFRQCLQGADSKNDQQRGETKPFSLGLYFEAWLLKYSLFNGERRHPGRISAANLVIDKREVASDFDIFRGLQRDLNISDAQLLSVSEVSDIGRKTLPTVIEHWSPPK